MATLQDALVDVEWGKSVCLNHSSFYSMFFWNSN